MILTVTAVLIGLVVDRSACLGLLLAGAIVLVNFHLVAAIVMRALVGSARMSLGLAAVFFLKFAFFFGSFALLLLVVKIHPLVLILGSSTLILAVLFDAALPAAEA